MRSASMKVKMALVLCCAGAVAGLIAGAVKAGPEAPVAAAQVKMSALPVNQWAVIYDGPPGIIGVHARLLWLPEANQGFLWPNYHYRSRAYTFDQHAQVHFFSPDEAAWTARPSAFPENLKVYPEMVGRSYAYLAGLKRVLLLQPGGDFGRTQANTWLFDPQAMRWEALAGDLRMSDRSADFNPAAGRDGAPVPLYGALCYDGHNGEAVAVGGGGTWGRVGKEKEQVGFGDWVYDETAAPKRIRRLTKADEGRLTEARKWYPANCGTWTFSEKTKAWTALAQPLAEQPAGRILPGTAYDSDAKKIVLFGGDDCVRCLNDTWVYDCGSRTWSQAKPALSPPPRAACAMVYLPEQKVVLLAGGYGPGWVRLSDTWVYETAKNTWTKLALDLPVATQYCSADYAPAERAVVLSISNPEWGRNRKTVLYGLRLDLASAPRAAAPARTDPRMDYHCKAGTKWPEPLPEEWYSKKNRPGDPAVGRKELEGLPANTWVMRKAPMKARARQWGTYIYDIRTHKGYAWGGGHYGYIGADVNEYDLLTNRWTGMADPVNYKFLWTHTSGGGSAGVSFQGWALMGTHARKSYAVDVLSDSVINVHGEVYSIKDRMYVTSIGQCPGRYRAGNQVAFVTTPHGVYGYHGVGGGALHRADVAAGKWQLVAKGGPSGHHEYCHLCYDARRDRLIYFYHTSPKVWAFDFRTKTWSEEEVENKGPFGAPGFATYVPDLDAALLVFSETGDRDAAPRLHFYKLDERKWYTAPYLGEKFGSYGNLNNSTIYDPELKLAVRISHLSRERFTEVLVMRLEPKTLTLTPME